MRTVLPLLALAACSGGGSVTAKDDPTDADADADTDADADSDTDADADSDSDADTDTGTQGFGQPTRLEVSCSATSNALRFLCDVTVEPAQPVELSFVRADGRSMTRTVSGDDVATDHSLPLYFMAANQDYDITIWATAWPADTATTSVSTSTAPPSLASYLSMTGTSTMGMIGSHFPCSSDAVAVVYDTETGDLLWYEEMDPGGTFGSLDMVSFTEDGTVLGESVGDVIEVDLMGDDVIRFNDLDTAFGVTAGGAFGNFHHDIMKRNGAYYVFYQESSGGGFFPDILDTVILFDDTGTELARWVPEDHLTLPTNWSGDFLHTNTIYVDEAGDIHLSWLTQDTIGKIDGDWTSASFGDPIWILEGRGSGQLVNTITTDWSAIGGPDAIDDPHCLNVRADGRIQLLDNRNGRGLIIDVDEVSGTATVDAAFDTRESSCGPQGTSRSTQAGNVVVGCTGDWVREYDLTTGNQIWEAEVQCPGGGRHDGSSRWYPLDGW